MPKPQYRVINPLTKDAFKNLAINLSRPEYDSMTERINRYAQNKQYDKEAELRKKRDSFWKEVKAYANTLVMSDADYELYLSSIENTDYAELD